MRKLKDTLSEALSTFWPLLAILAFLLWSDHQDTQVAQSVREACIWEPTSCQ